MSTLVPRKPYTDDELQKLYPAGLELQLVQILMRHGERTPVSARFQNAGLRGFWPYCASVRHFKSAVLHDAGELVDGANPKASFTTLEWKRRLETFGPKDEPVHAAGPKGDVDDVCDLGSLTDVGRQSTYKLGLQLRELYVNRLKFIPATISTTDFLYLRSTPIPRALESLQQTYSALYPPSAIEPGKDGRLPTPTILTRTPGDETLFPNDGNCRRFAALSRAFAQRTADRWNETEEMDYLNKLYGKWMPEDSPRVAVDSHPRLSGIMDTINATHAHGPETRLPKEFYDEKAKKIIEKIGVEEWYSGYRESKEYRTLGIGGLVGDVVGRMVGNIERSTADDGYEIEKSSSQGHPRVKFGLSGCHDTTLAAVLNSLGAYNTEAWPPFTSHLAFELFRKSSDVAVREQKVEAVSPQRPWWQAFFSLSSSAGTPPAGIGRTPITELSPSESKKLDGYYVRIRYNDEPVTIPACKKARNHLEGDETFCTFAAFKEVVDKFTPKNWKQQCLENLKEPAFPAGGPEWSGH